jgi:hypothetical protein
LQRKLPPGSSRSSTVWFDLALPAPTLDSVYCENVLPIVPRRED